MDHPQNQSAQRAALSAVNLAPAGVPSAAGASAQHTAAETLPHTHGLLILERAPDGSPSWLACKFCPLFGCVTRKKSYLMLFLAPFKLSKIEGHLAKEHPVEWKQFRQSDPEMKKLFFQGKILPAPHVFRTRLEELRKCWCSQTVNPQKSNKRKFGELGDSSLQLDMRKGLAPLCRAAALMHNPTKLRMRLLLAHSEDWVGRHSIKPLKPTRPPKPIQSHSENENKPDTSGHSPLRKSYVLVNAVSRERGALPDKTVYKTLREILERHSEPFSADLEPVPKLPVAGQQTEPNGHVITPPWAEKSNAMYAARTLFYLLRGLSPEVIATLLKESYGEDRQERMQGVDTLEKPRDVHMTERDDVHAPQKVEDVNMADHSQDTIKPEKPQLDLVEKPQDADIPQKPQNWFKFVSGVAYSIGMTSMLVLKQFLSQQQSWALVLVTRPCPVRKAAVEVLLTVPGNHEPVHLVSVRDGKDAVETVMGLLDSVHPQWPARLIGIRSLISADADGKAMEGSLVNVLNERALCDLEVARDAIPDEKRPIFPRVLSALTADDFREVVNRYVREPAKLEQGFVEKVMSEHATLCLRDSVKDGPLDKPWTEYEDLTELMTFVRGLELLWRREKRPCGDDGCRFAGLVCDDDEESVDSEVEHVFRARVLLQVEQIAKINQQGKSLRRRDIAANDLIRWGSNWSSLLLTC